MEQEFTPPLSPAEARASLDEISRTMAHTRKAIAAGSSGPIIVLWGVICFLGYLRGQFWPGPFRSLFLVLDAAGVIGTIYFVRRSPARSANRWRVLVAFLILFIFSALWGFLLSPWELARNPDWWAAYAPLMDRKSTAFVATVPMFAYVIMGLWLDRFFLWLGILVTLMTLVGYLFVHHYFYLWMAVAEGGSLIVGGLFIKKFWR